MKKSLIGVAGVMALSCFFGLMSLRQYYTWHRPESPQPELSRTVSVQLNYGKTVYVTPTEDRILKFTGEAFLVPLVIALIYVAFRASKSQAHKKG